MSFEAIKTIADVEAAAQKMKDDAVRQANALVENAKAEKEKLQAEAIRSAEEVNGKALEEAKKLGEQDAAVKSAEDAKVLDALRASAEAKLDKAVDLIVERIVNN